MNNDEKAFFIELIKEVKELKDKPKFNLNTLKTTLAKKHGIKRVIKSPEIIANSSNKDRDLIVEILNIKPIRELSGVTVVALFAKPHACPHGKCIYCPGGVGSEYGDTPQSYTGKEPAALRAIRNNYDPYLQVFNRLEHYCINGHLPDKLELIFMGGTFPSLDKDYRDEFTNFTYKAVNDFGDMFIICESNEKKKINYEKLIEFFEIGGDFKLQSRQIEIHKKILELKNKNIKDYKYEITRNETANIRSIGLTIETKPDWAKEEHCNNMLEYGCTRFEIGVQTLDENCLKKTNRGHTLEDTKKAFQICKDMAIKINAHMMLGLPSSTLKIDEESLINLFEKPEYRPDMLKIYPCLVVKGTPLYNMWSKGLFKPVDTKAAAEVIARAYKYFPRYVRVMRVQRDIPTTEINEGIQNSNLREYVDIEMKKQKIISKDIRAREIGFREIEGVKPGTFEIKVEKFESSRGTDIFIDASDENDTMIGFIRLRFPSVYGLRDEITKGTALIRELHVYGQTIPVEQRDAELQRYRDTELCGAEALKPTGSVQHKGWGRKLLEKAENIAKENGYTKMCIISGVGVREYYKKFGYKLEGVYMTKLLK